MKYIKNQYKGKYIINQSDQGFILKHLKGEFIHQKLNKPISYAISNIMVFYGSKNKACHVNFNDRNTFELNKDNTISRYYKEINKDDYNKFLNIAKKCIK